MKIALIGASGRIGSRLLAEMLERGHSVTGIARDSTKVASRPGLVLKNGDATRPGGGAEAVDDRGVVDDQVVHGSAQPR